VHRPQRMRWSTAQHAEGQRRALERIGSVVITRVKKFARIVSNRVASSSSDNCALVVVLCLLQSFTQQEGTCLSV
jgi:hypothetical protein